MAHYRKIPCLPSISVIRYRNDAWTNQFGDHFRASGGLCMMHDGLTAGMNDLVSSKERSHDSFGQGTRH